MRSEIEKEVVDFYKGAYQRPILEGRGFIEWVKERLGERARGEEEKPSSVSSVCLRMKARVEVDKKTARRARRIEQELQKSLTPFLTPLHFYFDCCWCPREKVRACHQG